MNLTTILLVSLALGTDAFSLAVGLGMNGFNRWRAAGLVTTVGILHVLMPLAGIYLGFLLGRATGRLAGYLGAAVLMAIGLQMLWEGLRPRGGVVKAHSVGAMNAAARKLVSGSSSSLPAAAPGTAVCLLTGLSGLVVLGGSVSLDALSIGFGLGTLQVNLAIAVLVMGVVAAAMTMLGFFLGRRLGCWLGEKAQVTGGFILLYIGLRMLL